MKTFALPLIALTALLAACGETTPPPSVVAVTDALCRPTPNGRAVTGCYLTLTASRDDRLVSVSSPVAAEAQVHETRMNGGIMSMRELTDGLALSAGEAVVLAPGSTHVMLLGVRQPLVAGTTVPLTLTFGSAAPVEIVARVGQPTVATSMTGHGSH